MIEFYKYFTKRGKGAMFSIFLLHLATLLPAGMIYTIQPQHNAYYFIVAGIALVTSLIMKFAMKDFAFPRDKFFKELMLPMNLFFVIVYVIFIFEILSLYHFSIQYFQASAGVQIVKDYVGPDRLLSFVIAMVFYNAFFVADIAKNLFGKKQQPQSPIITG